MKRNIVAVSLILVLAATSMLVFAQAKKETAIDPVCKITVNKDPNLSAAYKGETYYFCSKADMEKFKAEPQKYVKK